MVFWKTLTHFNRVHHKHSIFPLNPYMPIHIPPLYTDCSLLQFAALLVTTDSIVFLV